MSELHLMNAYRDKLIALARSRRTNYTSKRGSFHQTYRALMHASGLSEAALIPRELRISVIILWFRRGIGTPEDLAKCVSMVQTEGFRIENADAINIRRKKDRNAKAELDLDRKGRGMRVYRSSKFYSSPEWKALRYEALDLYGNHCMCCGRRPEHGIIIHVDHIRPRSLYPELALSLNNIQILCNECNMAKSNTSAMDWRPVGVVNGKVAS